MDRPGIEHRHPILGALLTDLTSLGESMSTSELSLDIVNRSNTHTPTWHIYTTGTLLCSGTTA